MAALGRVRLGGLRVRGVLRLDAAIHKDEKEAASAAEMCNVDGIGGVVMDGKEEGKSKRKRKRRGEGEIEEENDISNAAKLESMGYRELQALARARGLNANGGKKDVLQRSARCADDEVMYMLLAPRWTPSGR
ncbi:Poly [Hordeum vulgare]|nr:Poly [Hordeum vulgare]